MIKRLFKRLKTDKQEFIRFESATLLLFCWGMLLAFVIDITGWSAVIVVLATTPITHVCKFMLYKNALRVRIHGT